MIEFEEIAYIFPDISPTRDEEKKISKYVEAHQEEVDGYVDDITEIIKSRHVDEAETIDDLEQIGALFGELGRRRERDKEEYRTFLKSIVQSFQGRGTKPGMEFAVAAGINAEPKNVTIKEDFQNLEYTIQLDDVDDEFVSSAVNDMATLADPSGVELAEPPIIRLEESTITIEASGFTVTSSTTGLGGQTLGNDTLG